MVKVRVRVYGTPFSVEESFLDAIRSGCSSVSDSTSAIFASNDVL